MSRTAIIDVGGGFRGIYAAGILDWCMDHQITFDVAIGVSAGSANLGSFAANQCRRNHKFYTEYALRPEYAGLRNFLKKHSFVDLDYVYSTLTNSDGENPIDYDAFSGNPMEFYVVATDAETGKPFYFDRNDFQRDHYDAFKASSSLPFFSPAYPINGHFYYDGGISDPIPAQKALDLGCDRLVILLTRPIDFVRVPGKDERIARLIRKQFPNAAECLCNRAETYNTQMKFIKKLAENGQALIIAPDDTCGVDTLTRDKEAMEKLYQKGYQDGALIPAFLNQN